MASSSDFLSLLLFRKQKKICVSIDASNLTPNQLYEVLSWMSAESAIKYASLLRIMLGNIISERLFTEKQTVRALGRQDGFFMQSNNKTTPAKFKFYPLPLSDSGVPCESLEFLPQRQSCIFASHNGLLLMGQYGRNVELLVCNPVTATWAQLPTFSRSGFEINRYLDRFIPIIQCGYPESSNFPNDYMLAVFVDNKIEDMSQYQVWDLMKNYLAIYSNGKWEEDMCDVTIKGRDVHYDMPVAIVSKGLIVHYYVTNRIDHIDYKLPCIVAFDLKKKSSKEIELPKGALDVNLDLRWKHKGFKLLKWDDSSICFVRWVNEELTVWVLEKSSWRKVMQKTERQILRSVQGKEIFDYGVVCGGKALVVATKARVYVYTMEGELKLVGRHNFGKFTSVDFIPYTSTLRPLCI